MGGARHVIEKMKDIHFAAFCHFLVDLFAILSRLSLQIQQNEIILPTAVSLLKEMMIQIKSPLIAQFMVDIWKSSSRRWKMPKTFQSINLRSSLNSRARRDHDRKLSIRN